MRFLLSFLLIYPVLLFGQQGVGEYKVRQATAKDIITCPHSNKYVPNYTPRKDFARKDLKSNAAVFIPTYVDVPEDFQTTIEFVFETMSQFISSDIPINVRVSYEVLDNPNTLAQAGPSGFRANFPGAAFYETFYPIALAEKLAGRELNNPGSADLNIFINSTVDWHVPPNVPDIGNKFDLASTLMHEVIHGLGFSANAGFSDGIGSMGRVIYSRHIENRNSINLLDSIEQGTAEFGDELTSNNLFFRNKEAVESTRYKIYAPTTYAAGSSISHLDRALYQGSPDRMMIPFADRGDVNYNPGVSEQILHLMGWNITSVLHDPKVFSDNESADEDYLVTAKVNSDIGFDTTSFVLHYSTDSFDLEDVVVPLDFDPAKEEFSFLLEATGEDLQYQYYFELKETTGQTRLVPARANEIFFTFNLGADTEPPVIDGHMPLESVKETDVEFTLKVNDIEDYFTGADTTTFAAVISFNGMLDTIPFEIIPGDFGDFFEVSYNRPEAFNTTDELSYKLILFDKSIAKNQTCLPAEGFFPISVEEVSDAIITYVNDFETPSRDFDGTGFNISAPDGFSDPAIHSEHPYKNAGDDNTLNFTYELKTPILIDSRNPIIKFKEIVIVEPGEPNTTCRGANCQLEFWDYVVVEGKKIGGSTWQAFHDAYDARDNIIFVNAYNNEQAGTSGLFRDKEISLIDNGNFAIGDQVFIRFRLFSDPFAVGWGWAIDNLEIQPPSTNTLEKEYIESFKIFPNPISKNQYLSLEIDLKEKFTGRIALINVSGQKLIDTPITNTNSVRFHWDLSALSPGIYFAQLQNEIGVSVRKIIVD